MQLNKIIHEGTRLRIVTFLAATEQNDVSFNELQDKLQLTSGNLSVQLKKLEKAGYLTIDKTYKNNKPFTSVRLTKNGRAALDDYLAEMEKIIKTLK